MVKRFFAFVVWCVVLLLLLIVFAPKKELYYLGERFLIAQKIAINGESASDYGLVFDLDNAQIVYDRMNVARLENMRLFVSIFYNSLSLSPFMLSQELSFLPSRVDQLTVYHTIVMPHIIYIEGEGAFGSVKGEINLVSRRLRAVLNIPGEIQSRYGQFLTKMKREEEGFIYELKF
ncbi:MAG: hypothetical protein LBN32_03605 [Helicobacteraceae bacterium]|jgi:hypothetical protein|nr:hypothetical protein [Helicobacteraceae bacterium]